MTPCLQRYGFQIPRNVLLGSRFHTCSSDASCGSIRVDWSEYLPRGTATTADPLLLIHGFGCGQNDWGVLPRLIAAKSKRRVLAFDNRGIGATETPGEEYSVEEMATDARSVLDAAGVERAHVLGISLGGMVAQAFALANPDRTNSLLLGCTTRGGPSARATPAFLSLCESWAGHSEPNAEGPLVEQFIRSMIPGEVLDRPGGMQLLSQFRTAFLKTARNQSGLRGQLVAMYGYETPLCQLRRIQCPVLVVAGNLDEVVDGVHSEELAREIPNATLRVWREAGHFWWAVRTAKAAQVVSDFLINCDEANHK